jgi:HEAT repeat protein
VRVATRVNPMVIKIGPNGERRSGEPATEDDIKLLALNALLQQEPAKALPLLHDLILSDKPIEMRKQALFILSRSREPQAQTMLMDVVNSAKDPVLQLEAIQALAIYRPKDAGPTLEQVYKTTSDAKVKRAALNGLFIAHDATRLVNLARSEKDLNLKRDIVSQLALMHDPVATAYMEELLK